MENVLAVKNFSTIYPIATIDINMRVWMGGPGIH